MLHLVFFLAAAAVAYAWKIYAPFPSAPFPESPLLGALSIQSPLVFHLARLTHWLMPSIWVFVLSEAFASRFILESSAPTARFGRGSLPPWPSSVDDPMPSIVIGEVHHPIEEREVRNPKWLQIPAKGLFTGTAVFGAVGSGKTAGAIQPFARQLLQWQAHDPKRRVSGIVLEVKGSMCPHIRAELVEAKRVEDWMAIGIGPGVEHSWNPLDIPEMDSYSMASQVASLMNQLFGKGKEPFWQQAYTNIMRNAILLFRLDPSTGGWVTMSDLNQVLIGKDGLSRKLADIYRKVADAEELVWLRVKRQALLDYAEELQFYPSLSSKGERDPIEWQVAETGLHFETPLVKELADLCDSVPVEFEVHERPPPDLLPDEDAMERLETISNWYRSHWLELDERTRTNVIEGIVVFLGLFTEPDVRRSFCPPPPRRIRNEKAVAEVMAEGGADAGYRPTASGRLSPLPRVRELIETGKVVGMSIPSGTNPALARLVGVMFKQSWLQAAMQRPVDMATPSERYPKGFFFRPAMFLCDEYQMFATVGGSDAAGDETAFALTRESRVIPVIATQSISSLKSVTEGQDAWRTLLQTLRTKVFLTMSDDESCRIASQMCGKASRMKKSTSLSEGEQGPLHGKGSDAKLSYSYSTEMREIMEPRAFSELPTFSGLVLAFDGVNSHPPQRVRLKPIWLPRELGYFRQAERGMLPTSMA